MLCTFPNLLTVQWFNIAMGRLSALHPPVGGPWQPNPSQSCTPAYWFPQQTLETAIYIQLNENTDFAKADARLVVSDKFSSAFGAGMVRENLQARGLLKQTPGQGGSCAN